MIYTGLTSHNKSMRQKLFGVTKVSMANAKREPSETRHENNF